VTSACGVLHSRNQTPEVTARSNIDDMSIENIQSNNNLEDEGSQSLQEIRDFDWGHNPVFNVNMSQEYGRRLTKTHYDAASTQSKVVCAQSLHSFLHAFVCVCL